MMKYFLLKSIKRNRKYILLGLAFLVWMLFFDSRNVLVQNRLNKQIAQLETEYGFYEHKLMVVKEEYEAMLKYPEKYAREKYFMHKPGEEVFIYN